MNPTPLPADFDYESTIPLWKVNLQSNEIIREFIFEDFKRAFQFMTESASYAEEINHHPDWSNSWNKVMVRLTTHSSSGLTNLDIKLAQKMDELALTIAYPKSIKPFLFTKNIGQAVNQVVTILTINCHGIGPFVIYDS